MTNPLQQWATYLDPQGSAYDDFLARMGPGVDRYARENLGYAGPELYENISGERNESMPGAREALEQWMRDSGYTFGVDDATRQQAAWLDPSGSPIAGSEFSTRTNDSAFWNAALAAGALTGANMWDAGMIGGGGGGFMGGSAEPFAATAGSPVVPVGAGGTGGITSLPAWAIDPATGAAGGGGLGAFGGGGVTGGMSGYAPSIAGAGPTLSAVGSSALPALGEVSGAPWINGMSNSTTAFLGANVLNGVLGSRAADKSAQALQQAGQQSNDLQRYIFDTARADNKPLMDMRNSVLPQIQGLLSNPSSITSDPGYQFQFGEGQKALNNGAAARGMTYSGAQGKALQRYGQDYGATKLDQSLNRLTNVAGLGQVGANNNQQAGQQYGQTVGNTLTDMGSARGSAYVGGANAWGNALGNFGNALQMEEIMKRYPR